LSDAARKRLAPVLDKFEPSEASSYQARVAVERERVPVPWLPYLALVQIIGCRDLGTAEKTMWQVPFRYDRIEAMLTYEKFGLRLHLDVPHDGDDSQKLAAAIVGKLNAIVKTIEKETLQNLAKQKLDNGEVTLLNQQHRLRRAYEHFRTEAEQLLAASEADDTRELETIEKGDFLTRGISKTFERLEIGGFNAIAAINAYFSWLEHILTLALAFGGVDPSGETLCDHIGNRWGDKFRRIFNTLDADANRLLGRLHQVAEDYRNTFGHGGFDKHGATIGVQIEGIAPIPARLTDVRRSPHFELYPFAPLSFREVTAALDEVDRFLDEHPTTKFAMTFIKSGFDVPFDPDSRREYADAMKTRDAQPAVRMAARSDARRRPAGVRAGLLARRNPVYAIPHVCMFPLS
jgi:hypothetical protein